MLDINENSVPQTSTWENFNYYARYGIVPTVEKNGNFVPQNNFYQSVGYVGGVALPLGQCITSVIIATVSVLLIVSSHLLCTAFAYTTYLIAKGLAKITDNESLQNNTESLVDYSSMLQAKADKCSGKITEFTNTGLSYALTAVIWILASPITPVVWAVDKIASKFSEMKEPEQVKANTNEVNA